MNTTTPLPDVPDIRPFAASEVEDGSKPVYRPTDSPLPYSCNLVMASTDVMILAHAMRLHAEHVTRLGGFPERLTVLILTELQLTAAALSKASVPLHSKNARGEKEPSQGNLFSSTSLPSS